MGAYLRIQVLYTTWKIRFWAIPHQSLSIQCSAVFCCVPKPATARDLALSPWQSSHVEPVGWTLSWSLLVAIRWLQASLMLACDSWIPSLREDQGALTASAVSTCHCQEWPHHLSSQDLSCRIHKWRDVARCGEMELEIARMHVESTELLSSPPSRPPAKLAS